MIGCLLLSLSLLLLLLRFAAAGVLLLARFLRQEKRSHSAVDGIWGADR
jgi:hypothetical protein